MSSNKTPILHDGRSVISTQVDIDHTPAQIHRINRILFDEKEGLIQRHINNSIEYSQTKKHVIELERKIDILWYFNMLTIVCCLGVTTGWIITVGIFVYIQNN